MGARLFLQSQARRGGNPADVGGLSEQAVTAFLLAEASRGLSAKSVQGKVAELRSLLRFLYLQAMISAPLGEGVPPAPGWKDASVPRRLAATEVQALLDSCDRATASGKRDLAVLLLLARMGLRAAEVAGLELEDFDWRAGELVVRGKAGHRDRMPLPAAEVGEAVATYLLQARPRAECRSAFLTLRPPPSALRRGHAGHPGHRRHHPQGAVRPARVVRLHEGIRLVQGEEPPARPDQAPPVDHLADRCQR